MKKFTLLVCLTLFAVSSSQAQLDQFARSITRFSKNNQFTFSNESEMYDTLILNIDWKKTSFEESLKIYRSAFKETYGESIKACNKKSCLWESYFYGVQLLIYDFNSRNYSEEAMFPALVNFFSQELAHMKELGIDILETTQTPMQAKQKLFFSLLEASLSDEAYGFFTEPGLAFTKALLNSGVPFDTKTKARGWPKDATLFDHFMIRVYGLAPFEPFDSYPQPPSLDLIYDEFFSEKDINKFRWRGHNWFSAPQAISVDFIPSIYRDLLKRGYDLGAVCDQYCEGKSGLMFMASANLYYFGDNDVIDWFEPSYIKNRETLNAQDWDGNTALMLAAQNGNVGFFTLLLSMNADISIRNKAGKNVEEQLNELVLTGMRNNDSSLLGAGGAGQGLFETMLAALKENK